MTRTFSVAPMMDWTDRHDRYFLRLISRRALLYTEMMTSGAVLHGDRGRLLGYDPGEHPLALQVGGSDPVAMAACTRIAEDWGYDEVNINVGCPSDRVKSGLFGACLMAQPARVAECVASMAAQVRIPVTVKTRIGIDDRDSYDALTHFVETVAEAGCQTFIIHARKAWLQGLSPKENREIPPLRYDRVHRLKADFPHLQMIINGGFKTLERAREHLSGEAPVDGVMIGREVYRNPYLLSRVDALFYADRRPVPGRHAVLEAFIPYVERQLERGVPLKRMTRHILGLFQGMPGARQWRRVLIERAYPPGAGVEVIRDAANAVAAWPRSVV